MKRFFLILLFVAMTILTIHTAAAQSVSHVHWLADETAQSITIENGQEAGFAWKAQTTYYGLEADVGLYQGTQRIADYPVSCNSESACNGIGTLTQQHYAGPGTYTLRLTTTDALSRLYDTQDQDEITLIVTQPQQDNDFLSISVDATPDQGETPLAVILSCTATGGDAPISYAWNLGDGTTAQQQNTIHTYSQPGLYTATCTATDADGDTISGTATINAQEAAQNQPPQLQPIPDQEVDENNQYTYQLSVSDPDNTRDELRCYIVSAPTWITIDPVACTLSGTAPEVAQDTATTINVGVRDPEGLTDTKAFTLIINNIEAQNQPAQAAFSWTPATPEEGALVTFTSTSQDPDGTIVQHAWDLDGDGNDDITGNQRQVTWTYAQAGTYTVTLTVTDDDGAQNSVTHTLTVQEGDNDFTNIALSADPTSGERPLAVDFTCTAIGGDAPISYAWSFGDGGTATGRFVSHTYLFAGSYEAQCTATDADGDSISGEIQITVTEQANQAPVAEFIWRPNAPLEDEQVSFTDRSYDPDGYITSYAWSFGDGATSALINPQHAYEEPGQYTVTLTVTDDDGAQDSVTHTLTVQEGDNDFTSIALSADPTSGERPLAVDFTCTAIGGDAPINYAWSFGDGGTATGRFVTHTYQSRGIYDAECTATDADGDSISGEIRITVSEPQQPIIVEDLGCNPDVVRGHEEYCAVHVTDGEGNDLEDAYVFFVYAAPQGLEGEPFGVCTTNFKGRCHVEPVVDYEAGFYTVEADAVLQGYTTTPPVNDTFRVWEQRYEIVGLEVFGDDDFTMPQHTFYRSEDLYASFAIYDTFTQEYTCDYGLVRDAFLRVNNIEPLRLQEVTDPGWLSRTRQGLLDWFRGLFGADVQCAYQYWLPSIPLTDDFLGEGKVFAFTFNFDDNTAGQASREVTVLNNPPELDLPARFTINKQDAASTGSVTIDLKDYVTDVETDPQDMLYALRMPQSGGPLFAEDLGVGVYRITAGAGWTQDIAIEAFVYDTDGGEASDASTIVIDLAFVPEPPVAIAGPDRSVDVGELVSLDGSASYDPDGGMIVSYEWDLGDGRTRSGRMVYVTYSSTGTYTVTLTVTDDEGQTDTDSLLVTVGESPFVPQCSDGVDNDNDGYVDMEDPNCDSPSDNTEYGPISTGLERGIAIKGISTYSYWGYEQAMAGDVVTVEVSLENQASADIEDLRVGFSIPELGVKQKSYMFSVDAGDEETVEMAVYLPYDAVEGLYYTEITVANDDLRRSTHRLLEVIG